MPLILRRSLFLNDSSDTLQRHWIREAQECKEPLCLSKPQVELQANNVHCFDKFIALDERMAIFLLAGARQNSRILGDAQVLTTIALLDRVSDFLEV
jgi:hypothetical protein